MFEHSFDLADQPRVGYVVKRYPRYSETFIVNEVLAHEAAGVPIEIFSVKPPVDTHFQDLISRVRAPVHYLPSGVSKTSEFWQMLQNAASRHPAIASRFALLVEYSPADICAAVALAIQATESGITHLHAHFATSASDVAWLTSRLTDIPFTMTAHAKDIFHEDVDHGQLAAKLAAAKTTVTVSDFNVRYLRDRFGKAADRVVRIYNGLDLTQFPFREPTTRPPIILAVGRLVEKKGFDVLVDACAKLVVRGVEFQCHVIGDGGMLDSLRNQVVEHDIEHFVEFLGPQPQETVKAALHQSAVFAAPCVEGGDGNRDGLPTVLLESMALGTPCVSTPVTGIPEAIIHGDTGLMVPERDADALADALQRLLDDHKLAVQLARRAREHVEENFDVQRSTAALREWFGLTNAIRSPAKRRMADAVSVP